MGSISCAGAGIALLLRFTFSRGGVGFRGGACFLGAGFFGSFFGAGSLFGVGCFGARSFLGFGM